MSHFVSGFFNRQPTVRQIDHVDMTKVGKGRTVYMVIGCPGSGKSWVCEQLQNEFTYVHHDLFIKMSGATYVNAIAKAAVDSDKPMLVEAPFSISQTKDPLELMGFKVIPVVIQEKPFVIEARYQSREGKPIPTGHITRQNTYRQRALAWGAFMGTSDEVLHHLRQAARASREE